MINTGRVAAVDEFGEQDNIRRQTSVERAGMLSQGEFDLHMSPHKKMPRREAGAS